MPKRIADIAEELGVSTQEIIHKCVSEGIPPVLVQSGMSTVSAGLEATIRAWLSGPSDEQGGVVAPSR